MKTDVYTKSVLTFIALCLGVLVAKEVTFITPAHAGAGSEFAVVPLNEDGSMNVRVIGSQEPIPVHIESCDSYALTYGGPIEVKVKNWP